MINERTLSPNHTLLLVIGMGYTGDAIEASVNLEEEEDAELNVEDEEDPQTEMVASFHQKNLNDAKAICYEWMHQQYKRMVRLVGYTRLTVADVEPNKIVLASKVVSTAGALHESLSGLRSFPHMLELNINTLCICNTFNV